MSESFVRGTIRSTGKSLGSVPRHTGQSQEASWIDDVRDLASLHVLVFVQLSKAKANNRISSQRGLLDEERKRESTSWSAR